MRFQMSKPSRNCVVRLSPEMHKAAKLQAFKEGKTIQEWVAKSLDKILISVNEPKSHWLCEGCGGWTLKGTQMAILGKCENCTKDDIAIFPVREKI